MKSNYDEFLDLYKQIENAIPKMKNAPTDANVKWLEESIDDPNLRTKLYISRILRNYIQHNTDYPSFISINLGMISFLQELLLTISSQFLRNSDIMLSGKQMLVRYVDEDIVDTIKKMETKKQEYVPILKNDKIIGIFSDKTIRQLLIKNNKEKTFEKILTLLKTPSDVKFAKPEDTVEKTLELFQNGCKMVICTDNGKSTGIICGIIRENELKKN